MYSYLGHLAEGHSALAKSLFMGGVTRRFPNLPFSFLEGGVAWAVSLYSDLIGHWDKRGGENINRLNPANVDTALLTTLLEQYGPDTSTTNPVNRPAARVQEDPAILDEFAACGIEKLEDIYGLFVPNFFFG